MNNYPNQDSENQHKKQRQNNDQNIQNDQDVNMNLNFTEDVPDYYRNIFN